MKQIKLSISETVLYQRVYEVKDDFDPEVDSLEDLVVEDSRHGSGDGFTGVGDMDVVVIPQHQEGWF